VRGGSRAAEEPGRAEGAPAASLDGTRPSQTYYSVKRDPLQCQKRPTTVSAASLDGTRPSEKAEVLEKT